VRDMGAISSTPLATAVFGTAARLGFTDCTVVDEDIYIEELSKSYAIHVVPHQVRRNKYQTTGALGGLTDDSKKTQGEGSMREQPLGKPGPGMRRRVSLDSYIIKGGPIAGK
jgi:hypothetical protein